jgi:hypothetical protein
VTKNQKEKRDGFQKLDLWESKLKPAKVLSFKKRFRLVGCDLSNLLADYANELENERKARK